MRKFEVVKEYIDKNINIPKRATISSAGYDIESAEDIIVKPFKLGDKPTLIPTGLKVCMESDEYLMLVNRSSNPKKGIVLSNSIGIIDSDYYNNESNEGHIYFQIYNVSNNDIVIKKGDRIGQGIFMKYLTTDIDTQTAKRTGGFGSTNK